MADDRLSQRVRLLSAGFGHVRSEALEEFVTVDSLIGEITNRFFRFIRGSHNDTHSLPPETADTLRGRPVDYVSRRPDPRPANRPVADAVTLRNDPLPRIVST